MTNGTSQSIFLSIQSQTFTTMQNQSEPVNVLGQWTDENTLHGSLKTKVQLLRLNQEFLFRVTLTYNPSKFLLMACGQLIFNNGLTVPISSGHQLLFNKSLNDQQLPSMTKVVFSIDQNPQTLVFTAKVLGLTNDTVTEEWIKDFERQVLEKKKKIMCLLAVIGLQMEYGRQVLRHLTKCKLQLKNQLQYILEQAKKGNISHPSISEVMVPEFNEPVVIKYGPDTDWSIEQCKDPQEGKRDAPKKRAEGGYFTIDYLKYRISNKKTCGSYTTMLCCKTLRENRKKQEAGHQKNQKKMKKQLLILESIVDRRFLLKYYYRGSIDSLEEVLMEKYDYSLQEYIYYYGDCLEVQNKIAIAKQIVEAVISLHQSGVVHRDIKPSNFLIDDRINYKIKIIDFAESYSSNINFEIDDYGCSCPYSPLQCNERKYTSKQGNRQGVVRKQIDYWSVGITLYELFFRKLPVSFSRAFISDITLGWKNELFLAVNQRERYGLAVIDEVVTVICIKMMKIQQEKRMNLATALRMLELLENYVNNVLKLVDSN